MALTQETFVEWVLRWLTQWEKKHPKWNPEDARESLHRGVRYEKGKDYE